MKTANETENIFLNNFWNSLRKTSEFSFTINWTENYLIELQIVNVNLLWVFSNAECPYRQNVPHHKRRTIKRNVSETLKKEIEDNLEEGTKKPELKLEDSVN